MRARIILQALQECSPMSHHRPIYLDLPCTELTVVSLCLQFCSYLIQEVLHLKLGKWAQQDAIGQTYILPQLPGVI